METAKADSMIQKWLSFYWHELSEGVQNNWFVVTAALGSLVGLQAEQSISVKKAIIQWVVGFSTTIMVCLLVNSYFNLTPLQLTALAYFMGTVGNKITAAFILLIEKLIKKPKETLTLIKDILLMTKFK